MTKITKSVNNSPKVTKQFTTFELREVANAHNNIFMKCLMGNKLSLAYQMNKPVESGKEWARAYQLKQVVKEVDGI